MALVSGVQHTDSVFISGFPWAVPMWWGKSLHIFSSQPDIHQIGSLTPGRPQGTRPDHSLPWAAAGIYGFNIFQTPLKCFPSYYFAKSRDAAGPGPRASLEEKGPWGASEPFHSLPFHLSNGFLSPGTGVVGRGPEREVGPLFKVMNDAQPGLRAQRLPSSISLVSEVWIFSSPPHLAWMLPEPSAGKTQKKVCVGRAGGGAAGSDAGDWFPRRPRLVDAHSWLG